MPIIWIDTYVLQIIWYDKIFPGSVYTVFFYHVTTI